MSSNFGAPRRREVSSKSQVGRVLNSLTVQHVLNYENINQSLTITTDAEVADRYEYATPVIYDVPCLLS